MGSCGGLSQLLGLLLRWKQPYWHIPSARFEVFGREQRFMESTGAFPFFFRSSFFLFPLVRTALSQITVYEHHV